MKIYNEVNTIFNDDTGKWETISEDSFEYEGDVALFDRSRRNDQAYIDWQEKYGKGEGGLYIGDTDQYNIEALMENPVMSDDEKRTILENIMGEWTSTENIDWTNLGGIPPHQLANLFQDDAMTSRYLTQMMAEYSYLSGDEKGEKKYDLEGESGIRLYSEEAAGGVGGVDLGDAGTISDVMEVIGDVTEWGDLDDAELKKHISDSLRAPEPEEGKILWKTEGEYNVKYEYKNGEWVELDMQGKNVTAEESSKGYDPSLLVSSLPTADMGAVVDEESALWTYMTDLQRGWKDVQDYKSANVMEYDPADWAEQLFGIEGQGGALSDIDALYELLGIKKGEISGIEDLIGSEEEGTGVYGSIDLIESLIGSDVEGEETGKYADIALELKRQGLIDTKITGREEDIAARKQDIIDEEAAIENEKQKKNLLARESMAGIRDFMNAYAQQGKAHRYGKATGAPVSADPSQAYLSGVYGDVGTYERGLGSIEKGIGGRRESITGWEGLIGDYGDDITQYGIDLLTSKGLESGYRDDIAQYGLDIGGYETQIGEYGLDIDTLRGGITGLEGDITGKYSWMQDFLYGGAGTEDDPYDVLGDYGEGIASKLSTWL